MNHDSICPKCNEDCSRIALTELVYTFEPIDGELIETAWHKQCFVDYYLDQSAEEPDQNPVEEIEAA